MKAKPKYENGFTLEPGTKWRNGRKPGSEKGIYVIESTRYEDEGEIVAKLSFENGQLNGKCVWYTDEKPSEEFTYHNNVIDGWGCIKNEERITQRLYYKNGELSRILECEETMDGFFKEIIPIGNGDCLGIFRFDDEFRRQGIGYEMENGSISKMVEYDKDKVIHVIKTMKNGKMEEYDKNNKKCYSGGFEDNLSKHYPRCGEGSEFKDGMITYVGEWKENKRNGKGTSYKNRKGYYIGMWLNDLPDGEGRIVATEYQGTWEKGLLFISGQSWYDYKTDKIIQRDNITPPNPHPTPSPSQASFPQPFGEPTDLSQSFPIPLIDPIDPSQPAPTPVIIPQPAPTPGQFPQPAPTPVILPQSAPTPVIIPQSAPTPGQFPQPTPIPVIISQPTPNPGQFPQPTPGHNIIYDPLRQTWVYTEPRGFVTANTVSPPKFVQAESLDVTKRNDGSVNTVVVNPTIDGVLQKLNPPKSSSEKTKKGLIITAVIIIALAVIGIIASIIYNAQEVDVTLTTYKEFKNLDKRAKTIVIESFGILEVNAVRLDFGELKKLKSIVIGTNACTNVMALRFYNLPKLETITIGENSFTTKKGSSAPGSGHYVEIMNCPKLRSFTSEVYSFSTFGSFKVSGKGLFKL